MADFIFATGAAGDFRAGGYNWKLNWGPSGPTQRSIEAARMTIDTANYAAADRARATHPWADQSYQTVDAVFVRPAYYNRRLEHMFGAWGVHDYPREPPRENVPSEEHPEYWEKYGGRLLTTKDVALLLEFGFTLQLGWGTSRHPGEFVQYQWLYPAWNAEKGTVLPLFLAKYKELGPKFRFRVSGRFMSIDQVFGSDFRPPDVPPAP
jgi:hypothetical protein